MGKGTDKATDKGRLLTEGRQPTPVKPLVSGKAVPKTSPPNKGTGGKK